MVRQRGATIATVLAAVAVLVLSLGVLLSTRGGSAPQPATPAPGPATPAPMTQVAPAIAAPEVAPVTAEAATTAVVQPPSPTPEVTQYTVVAGDTMWDIALRFDVSLDEIAGANPSINPDLLHPGEVLNIPKPGAVRVAAAPRPTAAEAATDVPTAAPAAGSAARVAADAGGLRLRKAPSTSAAVIVKLAEFTPLTILSKSEDGVWYEVKLADGTRGWVMVRYVDTGSAGAAPAVARVAQAPAPISNQTLPRDEPYLSGFTTRAKEIFQSGQALGNHADVFAVVGDSNSASPLFLEPFDTGDYRLGDYGYLEDTVRYFKGSFRFTTVAAVVGFDTRKLMDPARADQARCGPNESPLACEYRLKKPSVALILIGTNDAPSWQGFEARYRPIVEYTLAQGIVPILMTKGDDLEAQKYGAPPDYINNIIVKLSREYGVPLVDLYQVAARLPANGFVSDGFHYNVPPDAKTAYFTGEHMNYGYTVRNLTALQALDAARRLVLNN
jgi:LysM repeat protein